MVALQTSSALEIKATYPKTEAEDKFHLGNVGKIFHSLLVCSSEMILSPDGKSSASGGCQAVSLSGSVSACWPLGVSKDVHGPDEADLFETCAHCVPRIFINLRVCACVRVYSEAVVFTVH